MTSTARRYGGQSAAQRDEQRRLRLRAACAEEVGERGYAGTTIQRICARASVSTRHFYLLHDGKEACFTDLYESIVSASFTAALASLEQTEGQLLSERVAPAFIAYISPMVRDVRTARIAFVEIMGISPQLEKRRLELRAGLSDVVEAVGSAAVAAGEDVADRDWRLAAIALAGAASSVIYAWATDPQRGTVEEIEAWLADLAETLLAG